MYITISIDDKGVIDETIRFESSEQGVVVFDTYGMDVIDAPNCNIGDELICLVKNSTTIHLRGDGKALGFIEHTQNGEKFTFGIDCPENTDITIALKLPPHARIVELNNIKQVFPDAEATTDMEHIVLLWKNQKKVFVEYTLPKMDLLGVSMIVLGVGILVGTGIGLTIKKRKQAKTIMKFLRENEMAVVELLKKNGGEMVQKEIEKQLDWSGPKLSKVLRRLEEDGIVKRIPKGRKNIVKLLI
ncbi:MAG: winged helix-turn-helix transcriptional regulator [Candidatus Diapherotrites archaeon]|nr:winged helix-turn-helix transcriptional regulator [Candidatus Diapherotrites archaeon]